MRVAETDEHAFHVKISSAKNRSRNICTSAVMNELKSLGLACLKQIDTGYLQLGETMKFVGLSLQDIVSKSRRIKENGNMKKNNWLFL